MKKILLSILTIAFAFNLNAQCTPDRHNTSWYDGWVSCESSTNPNTERGQSHWLMYDFGHIYIMGQMHIWNTNDPERLDWGLKTVFIDYSIDGNNWTPLGTFDFEKANGESRYEGFDGPDLENLEARYILITAIDNYGGDCYGMAELKIDVNGTVVATEEQFEEEDCLTVHISPNPFIHRSLIKINSNCNEEVFYSIFDAVGKMIYPEQKMRGNTIEIEFTKENIPTGVYFVHVRQGQNVQRHKLVKVE